MHANALEQAHRAPVHDLDAVGSTNALAIAAIESDSAVDGELFLAAEQTEGRGRLGRGWHSPPGGNLYLSLVVRRDWQAEQVPQITLAAGVAMAWALRATCGVEVALKWPNDLVVEGRKLGGILCQGVLDGSRLTGIVVGVGVNLVGDPLTFPSPLDASATTVEAVLGPDAEAIDRRALALAFAGELDALLGHGDTLDETLAAVREAWTQRATLPARVAIGNDTGTATAIDARGRLCVSLDAADEAQSARQITVDSGEVVWLS